MCPLLPRSCARCWRQLHPAGEHRVPARETQDGAGHHVHAGGRVAFHVRDDLRRLVVEAEPAHGDGVEADVQQHAAAHARIEADVVASGGQIVAEGAHEGA